MSFNLWWRKAGWCGKHKKTFRQFSDYITMIHLALEVPRSAGRKRFHFVQLDRPSFHAHPEAVNHSHSAIIQPIKTMANCVTSVIHKKEAKTFP